MGQYARAGTLYEIGLYSLGEAIVKHAFRDASHAFLHHATSESVVQSVLFIRGSGLETTIHTFGLHLHADILRDTFHRCLQKSLVSAS